MTKFKRGEHPALYNVRNVLEHADSEAAFFQRVERSFPTLDPRYEMIKKAYDYVQRDFDGIYRHGGDRYAIHCNAVALTPLDYLRRRNHHVIIAALFHDTNEDLPELWPIERVVAEFGKEVGLLLQFLSKMPSEKFTSKEERDIFYHGRFHSAPRDFFYIKLPDRLHNLLTIWDCKPEKIRKKVAETKRSYLGYAAKHCILIHELAAALEEIENSFDEMCGCEVGVGEDSEDR
ncbi:HD domain-containing protein [Patescibacteria group bacterium]